MRHQDLYNRILEPNLTKLNGFVNLRALSKIILIWVLFLLMEFSFTGFIQNENDYLPVARHFVDPTWLSNDWYLNLSLGYKQAFAWLVGPAMAAFGFWHGVLLWRSILYLFLAASFYFFFRSLKVTYALAIIVLFFFLRKQSIVAGEWIVGGLEMKAFAYAFVLLTIAAFLRRKYFFGFLFAGAAVTFHVLVGAFAFVSLGIAMLADQQFRKDWISVLKNSWIFLITGFLGLQQIYLSLLPVENVDMNQAWLIQVQLRLPHHLLPSYWGGRSWLIVFMAFSFLIGFFFLAGRTRSMQFLAAYGLGGVFLFIIGLVIYKLGEIVLLRYFWFRFGDSMILLIGYTLLAMALTEIIQGREPFRFGHITRYVNIQPDRTLNFNRVTYVGLILVLGAAAFSFGMRLLQQDRQPSEISQMFNWISNNTAEDSILLIDPTLYNVYLEAERSVFVTFKHFPNSFENLEWLKRLVDINGGKEIDGSGFVAARNLSDSFYKLNQNQINAISERDGIDYFLGKVNQKLDFPVRIVIGDYALFQVNQSP